MPQHPNLKKYEVSFTPGPPAIGTLTTQMVYASDANEANAKIIGGQRWCMLHKTVEVDDLWLVINAGCCLKAASDYRSMWVFGADPLEFRQTIACMRRLGHRGSCSVFSRKARVVEGEVVVL